MVGRVGAGGVLEERAVRCPGLDAGLGDGDRPVAAEVGGEVDRTVARADPADRLPRARRGPGRGRTRRPCRRPRGRSRVRSTPTPASMSHSIWATYPTIPPEWPTTWWPSRSVTRRPRPYGVALVVRAAPSIISSNPDGPRPSRWRTYRAMSPAVETMLPEAPSETVKGAVASPFRLGCRGMSASRPLVRRRRAGSGARGRCATTRRTCRAAGALAGGSAPGAEGRSRARARTRARRSRRSSTRTGLPAPIRSRRPRARRCGPSDDGPGSAPIGSPDRCIRRWRSVIGPCPPLTRNHGTCRTSLSSSESAPSRSSWSVQIAANDFEMEPISNRWSGLSGVPARSASPTARSDSAPSVSVTATASPGHRRPQSGPRRGREGARPRPG